MSGRKARTCSALFAGRWCTFAWPHVRITCPIDVAGKLAFAADAAPELFLHFLAGRAFIGAATDAQQARQCECHAKWFHSERLRVSSAIARKWKTHADAPRELPTV